MARPRIFISSTFYDLKHVRYDLEAFLRGLGYEPIMNDRGNIPYSSAQALELSCYDEVERCDILIGIIGNHYGTSAQGEDGHSISMKEIKTAIDKNKQVFIFIDKAVYNEYNLYEENKDNKGIKYVAVDDVRIHQFIEEMRKLPLNNTIFSFESSSEITDYLKEQFAGLFQSLLHDRANITERTTYESINTVVNELKRIVSEAGEKSDDFFNRFDGTMLAYSVPIRVLMQKLGLKRLPFSAGSKDALAALMDSMCFEQIPSDEGMKFEKNYNDICKSVSIADELFDKNGRIRKSLTQKQAESLIQVEESDADDGELPF